MQECNFKKRLGLGIVKDKTGTRSRETVTRLTSLVTEMQQNLKCCLNIQIYEPYVSLVVI